MSAKTSSEERRARGAAALSALGSHRSDHQLLSVQCAHAHHLVAIYQTEVGLVFESRTGPHSHGSKDFIDTGKGGSHGGSMHVDLLETGLETDAATDEDLPAWCDCGPRTLSRRALLEAIAAGTRTLHLA